MKSNKAVRKTAVVLLSVIFLITVVTAVSAIFLNSMVNEKYDEYLFDMAKGETVTELYCRNSINGEYELYETVAFGESKKLWYSFDEISDNIKAGFIAMEDRGFYDHNGIDIKRTLYAGLNKLFSGDRVFGASTITQQVIKNISGDSEVSIKRKLKEIIRAMNLEKNHTKNEIFEVYLNIVPMGEGIIGVGLASEIYFGKSPDQLTLQEAATLVGITNAPSKYNPHLNPQSCLEKRNKVLFAMRDVGIITEEEYGNAIRSSLNVIEKSESCDDVKSWFTETVCSDVIKDMCSTLGMSEAAASKLVYGGGLSIYTSVNKDIQNILTDYFEDTNNFSSATNYGLDYSMVVCDSNTGDLVGIVGAVGKKRGNKLLNMATVPHTPGSSLKPLAIYAPLIDEGIINYSTVLDDVPQDFLGAVPFPKNTPDVYSGLTTVKDAIKYSKNTVAVNLYSKLGPNKIYRILKNDYGFSTILRKKTLSDGSFLTDLAPSPLALGQLTYGVTLRELTCAYTVFPSGGLKGNGRSYTEVYDGDGKLILKKDPQRRRIMSSETANIMNKLLSTVVEGGTAKKISLKNLLDTAGKTGTSGDDKDRLFIGYTPYFTAGIWCGYRNSDKSVGAASPGHLKVWDSVMKTIHEKVLEGLDDQDIKSFSNDGLLMKHYCMDSGLLPCEDCLYDIRGERIEVGYYSRKNMPELRCTRHIKIPIDEGIAERFPELSISENTPEFISLIYLGSIRRDFPTDVKINDSQYIFENKDSIAVDGRRTEMDRILDILKKKHAKLK